MTLDKSPYAGRSPWVVDPDFTIWLPALRPVELEGGDLDLDAWAMKMAGGLRGLAYSPLHEQGEVNICATLAYVWRVQTETTCPSPDCGRCKTRPES